jgi:hypothetical protein
MEMAGETGSIARRLAELGIPEAIKPLSALFRFAHGAKTSGTAKAAGKTPVNAASLTPASTLPTASVRNVWKK